MVSGPPISTQIISTPSTARVLSPLRIALLVPQKGTATLDQLTRVTQATADSLLGAAVISNEANVGRQAFDFIESLADVPIYVLPFADESVPADRLTAINRAIPKLADEEELERASGGLPMHYVVFPTESAAAATAYGPLSLLEAQSAMQSQGFVTIADTISDTVENATAWLGANSGDAVIGVTNLADSGANTLPGSVCYAGHLARYAGLFSLGVHPVGLGFPVAGLANPSPTRPYSLRSATAAANTLAAAHGTSLVSHRGRLFFIGGTMAATPAGSALEVPGNRLIAYDLARTVEEVGAPFLGGDGSETVLADFQVRATAAIQHYIDEGSVARAAVEAPTQAGRTLTVPVSIEFTSKLSAIRFIVNVSERG